MHTCMHGEQTIIIFGVPCWFPSSRLSGLLWAKNGAHAWHNRCLFCALLIVIRARASSRVISSRIVTFLCCLLVLTCCFYPSEPNYEIVADCKMHTGVFPQRRALPPLAEPGEQRWGSCQPASSSVPLPCATNLYMINSLSQNKPRGVVQHLTTYMHKLCFVLVQMGRSTYLVHPSP